MAFVVEPLLYGLPNNQLRQGKSSAILDSITPLSFINTVSTPCIANIGFQRAHDAIITSLWRQNDVSTSFWRHNDVIFASCVRWVWSYSQALLRRDRVLSNLSIIGTCILEYHVVPASEFKAITYDYFGWRVHHQWFFLLCRLVTLVCVPALNSFCQHRADTRPEQDTVLYGILKWLLWARVITPRHSDC